MKRDNTRSRLSCSHAKFSRLILPLAGSTRERLGRGPPFRPKRNTGRPWLGYRSSSRIYPPFAFSSIGRCWRELRRGLLVCDNLPWAEGLSPRRRRSGDRLCSDILEHSRIPRSLIDRRKRTAVKLSRSWVSPFPCKSAGWALPSVCDVKLLRNSPGSRRPDFPTKSRAWNFRSLLENQYFLCWHYWFSRRFRMSTYSVF